MSSDKMESSSGDPATDGTGAGGESAVWYYRPRRNMLRYLSRGEGGALRPEHRVSVVQPRPVEYGEAAPVCSYKPQPQPRQAYVGLGWYLLCLGILLCSSYSDWLPGLFGS